MTREELAALVIATLDGQQAYFRAAPSDKPALLAKSKQAERELREACKGILKPPARKTLFEQTQKYRVVSGTGAIDGVEFEVPAGASEEEIATAAWNACAERLSYGWREVR